MMTIKRLSRFPYTVRHNLLEYSRQEFEQLWHHNTARLWNISQCIWELAVDSKVVCYCGLMRTSIVGSGAEFWFMACKSLTRHLRETVCFIKRAMRRFVKVFPRMRVVVDSAALKQVNFARVMGFEPTITIGNVTSFEYRKTF